MLDLACLAAADVRDTPWRWAYLDTVWSAPETAARLSADFPDAGFKWFCRDTGPKRFRYWGRFLLQPDSGRVHDPGELAPGWLDFADVLLSADYRRSLSKAIDIDLSDAVMEATFWRYEPGCWFTGHTGSPERIVNQVFYFNPEWPADWGGYLRVLHGPEMDDVSEELAPLAGRSALIVRSDHSWHAIPPVTLEAPGSRQTVVVSFLHR
jgi:SM-20-related protein